MSTQDQRGGISTTDRQHPLLDPLSRRLIPGSLRAGTEAYHQAITTVLFGLSMSFWGAFFAPIYAALGSTRGAVIILIAVHPEPPWNYHLHDAAVFCL